MSLPEMYSLDVDKENKIYFEVSGKKDGIPVFFVHGGPGGHCRSEHHSLFNPEIYFLISMPSEIHIPEVITITILSLFLSVIATIYPAIRSVARDPAEALRNE